MARPVKLDLSGEMIIVNEQVSVHRSLLWAVSSAMRGLVQEAEEEHRGTTSKEPLEGSVRPPTYLRLFDDNTMGECELGLKLYSGFLYGQSMVVPPSERSKGLSSLEVKEHYDALLSVHQIAERSLYCSEDTLETTGPDSPLNRVLMDFAVYGGKGKHWVELIDARTRPIPGFKDDSVLKHFEEYRKKQPLDELLRITNELCRMFVRKDADASAGLPSPDLMERCRYHSHAEKGLPCYLDK